MALSHWFLPHKETHKKAVLISWEGIVIYALLFLLLQVSFTLVNYFKPGVLGITGEINQQKLIELTNQERAKLGLSNLKENAALDTAAKAKAANMFAENYWAHFAPSGKSPWDFILGSGYSFSYAGENLAKNFYNPEDVMNAWMNSPSHKENIVNSKYQDIGMAVAEGTINGQKTTLVVQMFGTNKVLAQAPEVNINGQKTPLSEADLNKKILPVSAEQVIGATQVASLIDPYKTAKIFGLSVIFFMGGLLVLDLIVLKRRNVLRTTSHHYAHFALLSVAATALLSNVSGSIL